MGAGCIGVGDEGEGRGASCRGALPPKKFGKNIFLTKIMYNSGIFYFSGIYHVKFGNFVNFEGKYHVKFGNFVNFSCIYFRAKMSCPPKLTELLRLWQAV